MRHLFCASLLCSVVSFQLQAADPSLLLWLPFDEGAGTFACDRSAHALEADLSNVQWAKGAFGTALRFGGTDAAVSVPAVPGLNGATQFTLSVWATWEDPAPRRYPNLLSSQNWSPGGLMFFVSDNTCSFRMGRPGHRANVAGEQWAETGVPLLNALPPRRWTHLCVTFDLPHIIAYVNGKPAGRATWPYPAAADALRLGGWNGPVSHNGLLDDLRIYARSLAGPEIAALAADPSRADAAYALAEDAAPPAATFSNRRVTFTVDARGQAVSLRTRVTGRELLSKPQPLVAATLRDGRTVTARRVVREGDALRFEFPRGLGAAVVGVETRPDFFTFTVRELSLANAASLTFCALRVAPAAHRGGMANMLSDDDDAVCLRGYDLPVEMALRGDTLSVAVTEEHGLTGWRAGLAAGPKAEMPAMLRAMATRAGVPRSKLGGPWALGAEANRGSYLFADLSHASTDDWIEIARRGGFSTIHLHGWWQSLGHYEVNTNLYPRGLADMKDTVGQIHRAGLRVGIHTLTACIEPHDPWITPEANPHLIPFDTYTLARALSPTCTVLYVNERPSGRHDTVFTYSGNGNAIRVGSEIIQYATLSREPPYSFGACTRGAFKTRPAAHAAGACADYLQQRYISFYPQPDSPLADDLADCIARVYNTCGLDQLYFDGSEGMMSRYGIDAMRHKIFRRLDGDPLIEASCHGEHNWWFHSRLGAWDHPVWAAKRFHDGHVLTSARYRATDLLEPQMGWWAPRMAAPFARGHHLDEMEYFACKNLGLDAAMSIQGVNVSRAPLPHHLERQFTLLGWYEHLRLARYFDTQAVARVAVPGEEFRLRQARDGTWRFTPVAMRTRRVTGPDDGSAAWQVANPHAAQPLCLRVEALYAAAPADSPKGKALVDAEDFAAFKVSTASAAVPLRLEEVAADTRGGSRNLRLLAENRGTSPTGAWARAVLEFPPPYRNLGGTGAFGLWVKGDGSGALLNLQVGTPREFMHALSDHYVTLDFTGWRYVTLLARERDAERMGEHVWPYGGVGSHAIYRTHLDMAHISQVSLYLNAVPAGGRAEVTVSPIRALPTERAALERPVVSVNGRTLTVPFTLASGDFAELEPDGVFTHYSERGDPLARVACAAEPVPGLRAGAPTLGLSVPPGASALRAEVTVLAFGAPFGTPNPRRAVDRKPLTREYEMTRLFLTPDEASGASEWEVAVRPGERARLEIELCGGMDAPALTVNGQAVRFPVTLKAGERLFCRDGRRWVVRDAARRTVAEGRLPRAVPALAAGANRVAFACGAPDRAQVKLVKVYD
jgi:hypothetical protein